MANENRQIAYSDIRKDLPMTRKLFCRMAAVVATAAMLGAPAVGQQVIGYSSSSTNTPGTVAQTPHYSSMSQQSGAYGPPVGQVLRNQYNPAYGYGYSPYALSPYAYHSVQPAQRRIYGPTIPYTEEQYGELVLSMTNSGPVVPAGRNRSLLEETTASAGLGRATAAAEIIDVTDRGILVADTQEEIKLRGVRIPSERAPDDVTRLYAREAVRVLRNLTTGAPVYVTFSDPVRDSDGTLLATVYLQDGTNLNRLLLEYGYGQLATDDFPPEESPLELAEAQEMARSARVGLWSRSTE